MGISDPARAALSEMSVVSVMVQTLLLNATYEPLKVIDWQRAMTLWAQDKVEILETHDRETRSVTFTFKLPSVVRLLHFIKQRRRPQVQFTRANIYTRDNFTCQYCGVDDLPIEKLTFDHVVPAAAGGHRTWENIVTCCYGCNKQKGARTPAEAGMTLLRTPRRPLVLLPVAKTASLKFTRRRTPENWMAYLYWNVSLETR